MGFSIRPAGRIVHQQGRRGQRSASGLTEHTSGLVLGEHDRQPLGALGGPIPVMSLRGTASFPREGILGTFTATAPTPVSTSRSADRCCAPPRPTLGHPSRTRKMK